MARLTQRNTRNEVGRKASAEAAIRLVTEAAEANVSCPYRMGALIELPDAGEVMITGDLHGNFTNFRLIVDRADLARNPQRHLVLQELVHEEDLPRDETVCRSYRLVEMSARLKTMFPDRLHLIMGNHEFAEMNDLAIGKHGRELNELFDGGLRRAYGERWADVKAAYKGFWRTLPLAMVTVHGVFICHSTPTADHMEGITRDYLRRLEPGQDLERKKPPFYLLWGRDYSDETADAFARQMQVDLMVVAHTPCDDGYWVASRRHIVVDSSCQAPRYLLLPLDRPVTQEQAAQLVRQVMPGTRDKPRGEVR